MAVDGKDRLFWLCIADKFNGVLVQRSEDQGESWSEPVRLNHREKADSFTPSIAVNREGVIGVSWYEIHDKTCFDLYFTASLDSGKPFLPAVSFSTANSRTGYFTWSGPTPDQASTNSGPQLSV
jgi:hypothetical protein